MNKLQQEEPLSYEQSMGIIEKMIHTARNEHYENGSGWLIWGWLLFLASTSSAVLFYLEKARYVGWVWTVMLIAGLLIYFTTLIRNRKSVQAKSYVEELLVKFGTGFFISLFCIIAATNILKNGSGGFGYYFILYAFWMFIHGSAIRFRALIIGAIVNWIAAIAIFIVSDFYYAMIISSIAILIGYLIPGYMLQNLYKRKQNVTN